MTLPDGDTLYVTDAEIIRRSGIPRDRFYKILGELENKHRFPKKSPLFCGRRYWPAVKSWFDEFSGPPASEPRRNR